MDKKAAPSASTEAKAKTGKDPLAGAKAAFEEAVAKTKAQEGEAPEPEETVEVEVVPHKKPEKVESKENEELRSMREELAELKALLKEKPAKEEPEDEPDDYESVAAELEEQFGSEEGKVLAKALKAMVEPKEKRLRQIEGLLSEATKRSKAQIERLNKGRLSKTYPQLKDADVWETIQMRAEHVWQKNQEKFSSPDEAYDAVVKTLYGETGGTTDEDVESDRIAASTPTPPGRAKREPKPTAANVSRAVFDHLLKNPDDVSGAKRIAAQFKRTED